MANEKFPTPADLAAEIKRDIDSNAFLHADRLWESKLTDWINAHNAAIVAPGGPLARAYETACRGKPSTFSEREGFEEMRKALAAELGVKQEEAVTEHKCTDCGGAGWRQTGDHTREQCLLCLATGYLKGAPDAT